MSGHRVHAALAEVRGDAGAHGPGVTVLSQELWVLGTTPRFSRKAVSALPAESLLQLPNAILTNLIRYS